MRGKQNEVSIDTFVHNQIHYRSDNGEVEIKNLEYSIAKLREFLKDEKSLNYKDKLINDLTNE